MRVMFATSEVATLYKLGGLADVSYALPVALAKRGVQVVVVLPYYRKIRVSRAKCVGMLAVPFDGTNELVFLFRTKLERSPVDVLLIRHPRLDEYGRAPISETFAFFSQCAATFFREGWRFMGKPFDIIHCHDWHTALVPLLLHESRKGRLTPRRDTKETVQSQQVKSILTIHNLLYQGISKATIVKKLGIPPQTVRLLHRKDGVKINFLREGIEHADIVNTVSPTYAKEVLTSTYGEHVDEVMRRRQDHFFGILNGISTDRWNPATDRFVYRQYDRATVQAGKRENKVRLQKAFRLPVDPHMPLAGFVGRLEPRQKGIDIIVDAVGELLEARSFQLVIVGTGPPKMQQQVEALAKKHKKYISFIHTFDERLARRVFAASDILLVPSKFEPCGLTQLIAMRYGTIPLVRYTGGLADTVHNGVTGFVFHEYTKDALADKLEFALTIYHQKSATWTHMQETCMQQDFSWDKSARAYEKLYRAFLKKGKS